MKNYHYYLKQEIVQKSPNHSVAGFYWDPERTTVLHFVTRGKYYVSPLIFHIFFLIFIMPLT